MKKYLALCLCALLALASCTQEIEGDGLDARDQARQALTGQTVTLDAYDADAALATKTSRADDGSVLWSPGDKISLFYGSGSNGGCEFTSTNQEPASRVQFTGEINVITGLSEGTEDIMFWGVYPYDIDNSCDGSSVTMWLHDSQRAADNTWADGEFPSIGHSSGLAMGFYNLCGGLIFYLTEDGINQIDFQGKNNEVIAGPVKVAFNGGVPAITSFLGAQKQISLMAPSSYGTTAAYDTFKKTTPGDTTWYFMILPPMTFSNGHTVTFHKIDGSSGVREFGTRTVTRNKFTRIRSAALNNGVEFQAPPIENNQIRYTATEQVDYFRPQGSTTNNDVISNIWDSTTGIGVITFADAITVLDDYAFSDMNGLISITLPEGLTKINQSAFEGCENLSNVTIPSTVNGIARSAFKNCKSIETLALPRLWGGIGYPSPFAGCTNLKSFSGPYASDDGKFILLWEGTNIVGCALGAFKNQTLVIPDGVEQFSAEVFSEGEFTSVVLPETLKEISERSFQFSHITGTLTIPGSVTEIGESAFYGCGDLNTIIIGRGSYEGIGSEGFVWPELPTLGNYAFHTLGTKSCTIKVPGAFVTANNAGVYVSSSPWYGYRDQVVVYQADNEIWYSHENQAAGLDNSMLFTSLCTTDGTELDCYVIKGGFGQKETYDPFGGLASEPAVPYPSTFSGDPLVVEVYTGDIASIANPSSILYQEKYISLPHSVSTIADEAFKDATALLAFPSDGYNLQDVGNRAFQGCTAMAGKVEYWHQETINGGIPLSGCGVASFKGCTSIQEVILHFCSYIPPEAFKGCTALTNVVLEGGTDLIGDESFSGCSNLTRISMNNTSSSTGLLGTIRVIGRRAIAGSGIKTVNCHSSYLVENAFSGSSVTDITIRASASNPTVISDYAFTNCSDLVRVNIPYVEGTPGEDAFYGCTKLANVTLGTTAIPDEYFSGLTSLKTVVLPNVVTIGDKAFANTSSLSTLTLGASLANLGDYVFWHDMASTSPNNNKISVWFAGEVPATTSNTFIQSTESGAAAFKFKTIYILEQYRDDFANAWQNTYGSYAYWDGVL